ncbi:hypothetical protein H8S90_07045 [Olivibacter sp. SDN3]|uniref:hypothetical protein n=1 Tax=Olivibacter sp. SDN3 TaxID=2764720 RepID=UPI001650FC31|nr:hypothetical protein [Olivibacter sp. SDN3]QNL51324.1 hypothetical protein H8S90_07045 [Olivibacter sp. SDN3]
MKKLLFPISAVLAILGMGCQKQSIGEKDDLITPQRTEKLFNYLSNTLKIEKKDISFNQSKDSIIVKESYSLDALELNQIYERANEYHKTFEKEEVIYEK